MRGQLPFSQVDVFASGSISGNPVAVIHNAEALSDSEMAAVARWTNLSETTFLLKPTKPGADYRLRIFMPTGELPFAGHPTLGSAYAWLANGGIPASSEHIVQECGIGLVKVRRDGNTMGFLAPELLRGGELDDETSQKMIRALKVDPAKVLAANWIDNGPGWMGFVLPSAEDVLALRPDFVAMDHAHVGVIGKHAPGGPADYEVRALVPDISNGEDPATGSLNASFAVWLTRAKLAPPSYSVRQGTVIQREADLYVTTETSGDIWVSGKCNRIIEGQITI